MKDAQRNCLLLPEPDFWYVTQWMILGVLVILPNAMLVLRSPMYLLLVLAFGAQGDGLAFWVVLCFATGILNLVSLRKFSAPIPWRLATGVVMCNSALGLGVLSLWKNSFESSSSFVLPDEGIFLVIVGGFSLAMVVYRDLASRHCLRFTLREMAMLVAYVSLMFGAAVWIARPDRLDRYDSQQPAARHFLALGGHVGWNDWDVTSVRLKRIAVRDDDLELLSLLPQLRSLDLDGTNLTDVAMHHLGQRKDLRSLYLNGLTISPDAMEALVDLEDLRNLYIQDSNLTDQHLVHLRKMKKIRSLYLNNTEITDAGLEHLTHLNKLFYLHLPGTKVTKEGVDRFHEKLPNCSIYATPDGEGYSVSRRSIGRPTKE